MSISASCVAPMSREQVRMEMTYWTLRQRSETLLRVPMNVTGNAHAKMRPPRATQDKRYLDFISNAPSSRFLHTISFGCASSHLLYIVSGCDLTQLVNGSREYHPDQYLVITQALCKDMGSQLKVASDERTS